jgi:bacterioferritin-associated ferredoxin
MIVCHCARIKSSDIREAVAWMRASDPTGLITPGKVYRALGKRPECGGCAALFVDTLRADENTAVPPVLRGLRRRRERAGEGDEDGGAGRGARTVKRRTG